jgi:hypothetical protein
MFKKNWEEKCHAETTHVRTNVKKHLGTVWDQEVQLGRLVKWVQREHRRKAVKVQQERRVSALLAQQAFKDQRVRLVVRQACLEQQAQLEWMDW